MPGVHALLVRPVLQGDNGAPCRLVAAAIEVLHRPVLI
jgi:hypothetical protein